VAKGRVHQYNETGTMQCTWLVYMGVRCGREGGGYKNDMRGGYDNVRGYKKVRVDNPTESDGDASAMYENNNRKRCQERKKGSNKERVRKLKGDITTPGVSVGRRQEDNSRNWILTLDSHWTTRFDQTERRRRRSAGAAAPAWVSSLIEAVFEAGETRPRV
jgi:hypothetical protein